MVLRAALFFCSKGAGWRAWLHPFRRAGEWTGMRIHWRPRALWHRIVVTADVSSGRARSGRARLGITRFPVSVAVAIAAIGLSLGACSPAATPALSPPATETAAIAAAAATPPRVTARLITHPVEGREECHLCHGEGAMEPLPADHAGYEDTTCLACHDVQPAPTPPLASSAAEQGQTLWQERPGLACRDCHGNNGEGGYGPALAGSGLDFETFRERTRSPLSGRMPPIGGSLDDPAFETSGIWIGDGDLGLVYAWLAGKE